MKLKICKTCKQEKQITDFYKAYEYKNKITYHSNCKTCNKIKSTNWGKNNKDKKTKIYNRHALRKKYNMTLDEYEFLKVKQNNKCAICKDHQKFSAEQLCVDRDHSTGKVRGLLCHRCNICLGLIKDDPKRIMEMLKYLEINND